MTGLTVSDVFDRVKRTFGDESSVQVTEADIMRWINDSQRELVMQMPGLLPEVGYIDAVAGTGRIDIPADLYTAGSLYFRAATDQSYFMMKWLNLFEFNQHIDGWDGGTAGTFSPGVPMVYTKEKDKIAVFPPPQFTVTQGFKIEYAKFAPIVDDSLDQLQVPQHLHNTVVNYCLVQAYEMDEDWEAAQIKGAQVQGDINMNADREAWFGRETYPTITPTYADYETY